MKTLVHYKTIVNSLFQFGIQQPKEHQDRIWDILETSGLEIYISSRGLDTIYQDVKRQSGFEAANYAKTKFQSSFHVCPPVSFEDARAFGNLHGGNSYEELLEIYSASLISAEFILSNTPQVFSSFNLTEMPLTSGIDLSFIHNHRRANGLPILLVGDFPSIWFLINAIKTKNSPASVNLRHWFQLKTSDPNWHPIGELNIKSFQPVYRSRQVQRVKLISLKASEQREPESVALIVAVENPLKEFNVTIELVSAKPGGLLPNCLKLQVLNADGVCLEEDTVNHQNAIVMKIEGEESELFSVQINYNRFVHQENFII